MIPAWEIWKLSIITGPLFHPASVDGVIVLTRVCWQRSELALFPGGRNRNRNWIECAGIVPSLVLTVCVCLCICLALTTEPSGVQTWILACRSSGVISRPSSKVNVKGQGALLKKTFTGQWVSVGIVRLSVSISLSQPNGRTWILAWRSNGRISRSGIYIKVIGQRSRSPGQKQFIYWAFQWDISAGSDEVIQLTVRPTTSGVLKAYAVLNYVGQLKWGRRSKAKVETLEKKVF